MDERDNPIQRRPSSPFVQLIKLLLFGFAVSLALLPLAGVAVLALESLEVRLPDSD
jgi:hypothetical protein